MANLKNINFMSQSKFTEVETNDDELYAVVSSVVVESYDNGSNWYRIWSDGWIEQGGYINYPSGLGNYNSASTINFHKPFAATPCLIWNTKRGANSSMDGYDFVSSLTTTGFGFGSCSLAGNYHTGLRGLWWYACGQKGE